MLSAVQPTVTNQIPSRVISPFARPQAPSASSQDRVELSAPQAAPKAPPKEHKAALVAGVAALALAGIMVPIVGGVISQVSPATAPVASISQTVSQAAQSGPTVGQATDAVSKGLQQIEHPVAAAKDPLVQQIQEFAAKTNNPSAAQDTNGLGSAIAQTATQSAQQLQDANKTHAAWSSDVAAMQTTYNDLHSNVDAIMRGNGDLNAHHAAVDQSLAKLTQQFKDFQTRVNTDQPNLDKQLGPIRDNLNQAGVIEYNLGQRLDQQALQYSATAPERQMVLDTSVPVHSASIDLAMATERTTNARTNDKGLADALKQFNTLFDQMQKANDAAKKDAGQMTAVDNGTTILGKVLTVLQSATQQSQQALNDASARAHQAAVDIGPAK